MLISHYINASHASNLLLIKFFTSDDGFDPSGMFYIYDGYNFYDVTLDLELSNNQKQIAKFIKQFDAEMEVRK